MAKVLQREQAVEPDTPVVSLSAPRQRRGSLILIGSLVVVIAALVAAWLVASASVTHRVLVAGNDLKPGVAVTESDLRVVEIGGSTGVAVLSADDQGAVVGRFPVGPVPAGTALNQAMFVGADEVVADGEVLVGAVLRPGELPSGMSPGDVVSMVSTVGVADGAKAELLGEGIVFHVEDSGDGGYWVTLRVDADAQLAVAAPIATGDFRLGMVGP